MAKCRIGTAKFFTFLLLLYRTSVKLDRIKQQWGIPSSNTGILYLILSLLGLDIVVWALVQNEVNGMTGGAAA